VYFFSYRIQNEFITMDYSLRKSLRKINCFELKLDYEMPIHYVGCLLIAYIKQVVNSLVNSNFF
jgi:hypothetical protein